MTKHAKYSEEVRRNAGHSLLGNVELDVCRVLELNLPLLRIGRFDVQLLGREVEVLDDSLEHTRITKCDDQLKRMRTTTAGLNNVCLTHETKDKNCVEAASTDESVE